MKRAAFHILFWVVYLVQDTMLAFLTDANLLNKFSTDERIIIALKLCAVLLLPKIIFTYLLLYVILDRIVKQVGSMFVNISCFILAFVITLLVYRAIYIYYFFPYIYNGLIKPQPFFRPVNFLFALMDLGFVSGAAIVIRQIRLQLIGKEKEKLLIKEKLETELKFLKNQTNPHFLFNTLNNIYALARKKSDKTADVVMKLSKILRFMLYESGKKFITIAEEIKLIEDYIDLERIRYNERLNISFRKTIDDNSQQVSPLLLLPFVENAFKHGVSETRFDSFIHINIRLQNGMLDFAIENTRDEGSVQPANDRIGLGNIRRQLELMYNEYEMNVDSGAATFKVTLNINLNKYGKI
ncbi:MAG: sensor histidine kinase [Bacteroidota bacterium]